jgi:polyhydroxyalkanoate synthesis regulator phasin
MTDEEPTPRPQNGARARERAEEVLRDLLRAGEYRAEQAGDRAKVIVEKSKDKAQDVVGVVKREVEGTVRRVAGSEEADQLQRQVDTLEAEVARLGERLAALEAAPAARKSASRSTKSKESS